MSVDDDWECFNENNCINNNTNDETIAKNIIECTPLKISTKTKIIYLNNTINLEHIFWNIPLIKYMDLKNGVIKKQIKIQTNSKETFDELTTKKEDYKDFIYKEHVIYDSTNVSARQDNFKDIRKISIGLTKKDITTHRSKEKSAFYNCFVIILRLLFQDEYKEVHVKIFNTGKMEIPGVHNDTLFKLAQNFIISLLEPEFQDKLYFKDELCETVLINSNFNSGFSIKRCQLHNLLRLKYNISTCYDPCSYPGIQCKYNFKDSKTTISFMIFRTGSVLIVGKCEDEQLYVVYNFLKQLFIDEYENIKDNYLIPPKPEKKNKKKKKKTIILDNSTIKLT